MKEFLHPLPPQEPRAGGPPPAVFWLTGISGAGKTTIAGCVIRLFTAFGWRAVNLDGDELRRGLNADLGFSDEDRAENVRRIAEVASLMADAGLLVVVSCISPKQSFRETAKAIVGAQRFIEVHIDTPLDVAESRDPKGLYRLARAGNITGFTGIHADYEVPTDPQLRIDTTLTQADPAANVIRQYYVGTRLRSVSIL